ncbi:MAG: beta-phosphoglucomutase [Bacillota bacterium]|nr:beta-phosphoglucomutase [Bacillota bacterium]
MKPQGIVFDLDGVLVSTDELHYRGWKALADREGIPFDRTINHRLRGVSRMESLDIILEATKKAYTVADKAEMATFKNSVYVRSLQAITPKDLLPGVPEVLAVLKTRGLPIAIGSSSKNARLILGRLGLAETFDAVVDGNEITKSKPDPEVFLKAALRIGVAPALCLVVEDAVAGISAAVAAGMIPVAIGDAIKSPEALYRLTTILDIIDLI